MKITAVYKLVERTSLAPSMINVIPAGPVPAKAGSGNPRRQISALSMKGDLPDYVWNLLPRKPHYSSSNAGSRIQPSSGSHYGGTP